MGSDRWLVASTASRTRPSWAPDYWAPVSAPLSPPIRVPCWRSSSWVRYARVTPLAGPSAMDSALRIAAPTSPRVSTGLISTSLREGADACGGRQHGAVAARIGGPTGGPPPSLTPFNISVPVRDFAPTTELRISIERDRFVVLSDRDVLILNLRSAAGLRCASGSPHPDAVDPVPLK